MASSSGQTGSQRYFCHRCSMEGFICPTCGEGFLEALPPSPAQQPSSSVNDPIQFLGRVHFGGPAANPMQMFIETLMNNLSNGGGAPGQFQFTIGSTGDNMLHGNLGDYAWGAGGLDQIVTQLLNQIEGGAAPLTAQQLMNLPMGAVNKAQVENRSQCTTCMDDFKLNESVARLNCAHIFHRDCIVPWLLRHSTCPICRANVDPSAWRPVIDDLD